MLFFFYKREDKEKIEFIKEKTANVQIQDINVSVPQKIKVSLDKYTVDNNFKVGVMFDKAKQKNKFRTIFSVKDAWRQLKPRIISGVATAVVAVMICAGVNSAGYRIGCEVIVGGASIGVVANQDDAYQAIYSVKEDLAHYAVEASFDENPSFISRIVNINNVTSVDDMKNNIFAQIDHVVEAYGIYLDGEMAVAVLSQSDAEHVLESYKATAAGENLTGDAQVEFDRNVEIKKQFLPIAIVKTPDASVRILGSEVKERSVYLAKADDTLWGIAQCFGTSVDQILAINPDMGDRVKEGIAINIEQPRPLLGTKITQTIEYTEQIAFEVKQSEDGELYKGRSAVISAGVPGESRKVARVVRINGAEVSRDVLSEEIIKNPVAQVEKVGTKETQGYLASGSFIRPAYGSLTSRFGSRWGSRHDGIDIAGTHGSDIKAADGGVVIFSGTMDGYGYLIQIDHGNGLVTYYGHCSSLVAKKGQRVSKGEVIAKMGNTGRSTGTHLHFEVRRNGVPQNPLGFIKL